jgi:hypothetical protein
MIQQPPFMIRYLFYQTPNGAIIVEGSLQNKMSRLLTQNPRMDAKCHAMSYNSSEPPSPEFYRSTKLLGFKAWRVRHSP